MGHTWDPILHIKVLHKVLDTLFPIQLLAGAHPGWQQMTPQVLGSLQLIREAWVEFQAPGFHLAWLWLLWASGR